MIQVDLVTAAVPQVEAPVDARRELVGPDSLSPKGGPPGGNARWAFLPSSRTGAGPTGKARQGVHGPSGAIFLGGFVGPAVLCSGVSHRGRENVIGELRASRKVGWHLRILIRWGG